MERHKVQESPAGCVGLGTRRDFVLFKARWGLAESQHWVWDSRPGFYLRKGLPSPSEGLQWDQAGPSLVTRF